MFRALILELLRLLLRLLAIAVGIRVPSHKDPVLALPWGNHWKLFGHQPPYLRVFFLPSSRVRYGWQEIALEPWPVPDFPNIRKNQDEPEPPAKNLACVLLAHTFAGATSAIRNWQAAGFAPEQIHLAFGGGETDFAKISHPHKYYVTDPQLRVFPFTVRKQSYLGVYRALGPYLIAHKEITHVFFAEYDLLPLQRNLKDQLLQLIPSKSADGLFPHLSRVDQTNAPHYLYHLSDPNFPKAWEKLSLREDKHIVLQAMGVCALMTREAWLAYAETKLPTQVYLEMEIPTTLHHLGFRVCPLPDTWCRYLTVSPVSPWKLHRAQREKAPWIHPLKTQPSLP